MSASTSVNLMRAHQAWAEYPNDERYLTVEAARDDAREQFLKTKSPIVRVGDLRVQADAETNDLYLVGRKGRTEFTYHGFGQLAQRTGVGRCAPDMRRMPAPLAKQILDWGIAQHADHDLMAYILPPNGENGQLLAMTGTEYGRIPNWMFLEAFVRFNEACGGIWDAPLSGTGDPKRDATVYYSGSKCKCFLLRCDERATATFEVGSTSLKRGFMAWNSELGDSSWGITAFTYDRICQNRIIWGAANIREFRGIHRKGTAERFEELAGPILNEYAHQDVAKLADVLAAAQRYVVGKTREDVVAFLEGRKWAPGVIQKSLDLATIGGENGGTGDPTILYNVISGATAYARDLERQDQRVDLERSAGALLDLVSRN